MLPLRTYRTTWRINPLRAFIITMQTAQNDLFRNRCWPFTTTHSIKVLCFDRQLDLTFASRYCRAEKGFDEVAPPQQIRIRMTGFAECIPRLTYLDQYTARNSLDRECEWQDRCKSSDVSGGLSMDAPSKVGHVYRLWWRSPAHAHGSVCREIFICLPQNPLPLKWSRGLIGSATFPRRSLHLFASSSNICAGAKPLDPSGESSATSMDINISDSLRSIPAMLFVLLFPLCRTLP
ncbi:hypothetical protein EV702DRAFT_1115445, partial [Suillus placidus]